MESMAVGYNLPNWDAQLVHRIVGGLLLTGAFLGIFSRYFGLCAFPVPVMPSMLPVIGHFSRKRTGRKKVRVYMDGCFDLMHYGHANALRQAKALGDELVVGVVSDAEITENKGPPVMSLEERIVMVSAVKWVDDVIPDAPYAINEDFMRKLFTEYNIDYI
eukprot:c21206_g1_i1 orf=240-722(+)